MGSHFLQSDLVVAFSIRRFSTNHMNNEVSFTAFPCYKSTLPEAKIAADLFALENDLKRILSILKEWLLVQENDLLCDAFFSAALIKYRRCFNGGIRSPIKYEDIAKLPNNAVEFHDFLFALANKLIAHSVNGFEQTEVGIAVSDNQHIVCVANLHSRSIGLLNPRFNNGLP